MKKENKVIDADLVVSMLERHGFKEMFENPVFGFAKYGYGVYNLSYVMKKRLGLVHGLDCISNNILGYVIKQIESFVKVCNDYVSKSGSIFIGVDVVKEFKSILIDNIKGYCGVCSIDFDDEELSCFVVNYLFRMFVSYDYVKEVDSIISVNFLGNDAKLVSIDKEDRDKGFCFVSDTNHDIDMQLRKMYIEECKRTILWNIYEVSRGLNLDVKEIEDNIINKYDADDFSRLMFKLKKMKVDLSSNKNMPEDVKEKMNKYSDSLCSFKIDKVDDDNIKCNKRNFIRKYDSITGELIDTYYSITEAVEKNVGYTKAGISQCINGKRKSYKGFIWKKD